MVGHKRSNEFHTGTLRLRATTAVKSLLRGGNSGARSARSRERYGKRAALACAALNLKSSLMPVDDVLDDREPETRATLFAASLHIDAIKALGKARDRVGGDALAVIAHARSDRGLSPPAAASMHERQGDPDAAALPAILDRIVDQILEELDQLIALS